MPGNTGWQYTPYQNLGDTLGAQVDAEGNPNVRGDNGNATASSPFLAAGLANSSVDTLTNLSTTNQSWGATAANITSVDLQAANNQTQALAYKNAQTAYKQQQARLNKLIQQAEKQGQQQQAKMYQQEQKLTQQIQQSYQAAKNASYSGYNYTARQGTGAVSSARGLSAEGRSQLATAQADGYNLSTANYDRTYHYNNQYSAMRNSALSQAYSWLGTHYVLGGEKNQVEVDCSGLVQAIYSQLGFAVPTHSAEDQGENVTGLRNNGNGIPGIRTAFANLEPGDLVCWKDGSHIAIYAGNGEIIEAANTRVGTVRRPLWDSPNNVIGLHLTFKDEGRAQGQGRR